VYVKKDCGHERRYIMIKTSGHYTAVLAFYTNGTKLPPLLLRKRKMKPSIKIQSGIVIHIHMKG
jgi:hypothetical protein